MRKENGFKVTISITLPKGAVIIPEDELEGWSQLWRDLQKDHETLKQELLREEMEYKAAKMHDWLIDSFKGIRESYEILHDYLQDDGDELWS